jgi:spermidine synthase
LSRLDYSLNPVEARSLVFFRTAVQTIMAILLYILFFTSGAAALVFEMLWFRQAGLALGNSVWASSLVLAGFMGGLALGNAVAARYGGRVRNAVHAYALAEGTIAISGIALVFLLPGLGTALVPWLRSLQEHSWLLNGSRLLLAFALLLVPSTAMGVTLPLLTKALMNPRSTFATVLGSLYGWNTAGAVAGVMACEMYLVRALGVHGTALFAGALNLFAAATAAAMSSTTVGLAFPPSRKATADHRGLGGGGTARLSFDKAQGAPSDSREVARRRAAPHVSHGSRRPPRATTAAVPLRPWLAAAFLSGFCLLALEVVWFRFLLLFVKGHSEALALILSLVLIGIALGGLAGAWWLRMTPTAHQFAASVACAASASALIPYALVPAAVDASPSIAVDAVSILRLGAPLILPVSICSGLFFTLIGGALRDCLDSDTATAGTLTLTNTTGAALGSLAGGLLLLPLLGIEASILLVAIVYGVIGALLIMDRSQSRAMAYTGLVAVLLCLMLFPYGSMETRLVPAAVMRWFPGDQNTRTVAVREGLTETIVYIERQMLGRPASYAMLTNAFSMSATSYGARRYMKLYVYWPLAVHPNLKRALLIGYGVGNTAKAMTESASFETIDVVDLSRDSRARYSVV